VLDGMLEKDELSRFRLIGFIEGWSYIILLFIAMPLKYIFDIPLATRIIGMTHGILFIIFIIFLFNAFDKYKWSLKNSAIFFLASLIPFGTFFSDKKLKELQNQN